MKSMPPINDVPNVVLPDASIPNVWINGTGIRFVRPLVTKDTGVREVRNIEHRNWLIDVPQSVPQAPPVVVQAGTPIVNMPGCVKVNKENAKNPPNKNMNLVNDDPKQNVVLCDGGMPYYEPPEYDYRELSWQTVYVDQENEPEGLNTEEPELSTDTPETPDTSQPAGEVECPPPNARRIGDLNQAGTEKVIGHKLSVDGKICITQWEDVPAVEQFLPSIPVVTTTATIATVATASALFAKPIADLLLKVVKPIVKKAIGKVQKILGKTPQRPSRSEVLTDRYREKKGLLPLKKLKKKTEKKGR